MTGSIAQRLEQLRSSIPDQVRLIAVTKQVSIDAMREAYAAGVRDFAESKIQEALPKQEQLADLKDICWHFIGHIQSNKARKITENFHWIHAVDSLKLAQYLNQLARDYSPSDLGLMLQVKILTDPTKYGWNPAELIHDLEALSQLSSLKFRGLMTILPFGLSSPDALAAFQATARLAEQINRLDLPHLDLAELSMGMSNDYQSAIEAGATMIRLGTIIFGQRNP